MEQDELLAYQKLTTFQKDIVDALKNIGFKYKYHTTWEKINWTPINVGRINSLSELINLCYQIEKDQKRFEFQRVLGI